LCSPTIATDACEVPAELEIAGLLTAFLSTNDNNMATASSSSIHILPFSAYYLLPLLRKRMKHSENREVTFIWILKKR